MIPQSRSLNPRTVLFQLSPLTIPLCLLALLNGCSRAAPYGMEERPQAVAYLNLPADPVFPVETPYQTEIAFPQVGFRNPVFLVPEPGSNRLFVGELDGKLFAIDGSNPQSTQKQLVLDLSDNTQGGWDTGLLNLVFHPQYDQAGSPNRGFVYVFYAWKDDPIKIGRPASDTAHWTRLSRFEVNPQTGAIDPNSELILINQYDQHIFHAGSGMFFHPEDGFLYITVGDEGLGRDGLHNSQVLDRNLFSGVLRIDVDQRGGDISHPIVRQPRDGQTGHYYIPNDNPFVGEPVLEEFYALGLRSPHRMTYDPVDNLAWIGEIGQAAFEEIDVLPFDRAPLNYQWSILEGSQDGFATEEQRQSPPGIWTDPAWEYGRDEGGSITGGYVYRGERLPDLQGKYIFADFSSGRIWAMSYGGNPVKAQKVELLARTTGTYNYYGGQGGVTSFGVDHQGELYILYHGLNTRIARLSPADTRPGNVPELLSQTGVFADLPNLVPAAGLIPYEVNAPQYADGATSQRWIAFPDGQQIAFDPNTTWKLPAGTVLVQHFEMPVDAADPTEIRRLETRLEVVKPDGSAYPLSYRWREDRTDADLVTISRRVGIPLASAEGRERQIQWTFMAPQTCAECHTPGAGHVLGANRARQINRPVTFASGVTDNQLRTWHHLGLFAGEQPESAVTAGPQLAHIADETASLEHRVRSYLDVNCAQCHGATALRAAWNGNFNVPLENQNLINGILVGDNRGEGYSVVTPGQPDRSVLYLRANSRDISERMPPVGINSIDDQFIQVLEKWILELLQQKK